MTNCINLKEQFGKKYQVRYEESYYAEYGPNAVTKAPQMMFIPCKNGHICPWDNNLLAACTNASGSVATRLRKLPFITIAQDGDDGVNATFEAKHMDKIAAIMRPRKNLPFIACSLSFVKRLSDCSQL